MDLPDEAWRQVCAAAEGAGLVPDTEARALLSVVLFEEYPAFTYDRERTAEAIADAEKMLKRIDAFAQMYWQRWRPALSPEDFKAILEGRAEAFAPEDVRLQRDFWSISRLRRRPMSLWCAARAIRRASPANPQREWVISRLCDIWLNNFGGQHLGVRRPSTGGKPYGPLIDYLLAALRQVIDGDLPDAETLKDHITRERRERDRARQLQLFLKERFKPPVTPPPDGATPPYGGETPEK